MERRALKPEEIILVEFLLHTLGFSKHEYPIEQSVYEYEGGKMGSISFSKEEQPSYAGDLIQVEHIDIDGIPVIITLTIDTDNRLLDLDFWKEDFSALKRYPSPNTIQVLKTCFDADSGNL